MGVDVTVETSFPILKAGDLTLRALTVNDLDAISVIWGSRQVTEKMSSGALSREDSARMLDILDALWGNDTGIRWGIEQNGRLIGTCGFHNIDRDTRRGELGYELDDAFWGRGLMERALRPVLDYGFGPLCFRRIEAFTNVDNDRSAGLLMKLGFQREGRLRDYALSPNGLIDQNVYSLLSREHNQKEIR